MKLFKSTAMLALLLLSSVMTASANQRFFVSEGYFPTDYAEPSLAPGTFVKVTSDVCGLPMLARTTEMTSLWSTNGFSFAYPGQSGWQYASSQWISFNANTGNPYGSNPYVSVVNPSRYQHLRKIYLPVTAAPTSVRLLAMGSDTIRTIIINGVSVYQNTYYGTLTGCDTRVPGCKHNQRLDNDVLTINGAAFTPGYNTIEFIVDKKFTGSGSSQTGFGLNYLIQLSGLTDSGSCPSGKDCGYPTDDTAYVNMSFSPR